jgi:hypothetical protein
MPGFWRVSRSSRRARRAVVNAGGPFKMSMRGAAWYQAAGAASAKRSDCLLNDFSDLSAWRRRLERAEQRADGARQRRALRE